MIEPIKRMISDLGKIPPELRKELRPAMKTAADPALQRAKSNASWSSRIPSAIRIAPYLSKRQQGVTLRASAKRAPHARAYEGISGKRQQFRHPVFGKDRWVSQSTRPFMWPAVKASEGQVREQVNLTIAKAVRMHGFK